MAEYLRTAKSQELLNEWMKSHDIEPEADLGRDAEDNEEPDDEPSVSLVDRNVVRKRLLDKLGEKMEILAFTKNSEYYRNNFYDPLTDDM